MRNATTRTTFGPRVIALVLAAVTAASMVLTGCGVGKKKATGPPGAKVEGVDVKEGAPALLEQRPRNTRFAVLPTG